MGYDISDRKARSILMEAQLSVFREWVLFCRYNSCKRTSERLVQEIVGGLGDMSVAKLTQKLRCIQCGRLPSMARIQNGTEAMAKRRKLQVNVLLPPC